MNKSEDELKDVNKRLTRWIDQLRYSDANGLDDNKNRLLDVTRGFLQSFDNEMQHMTNTIESPLTIGSLAKHILTIKLQLRKIQPLFLPLERALHKLGLNIRHYSLLVQWLVTIVGYKLYSELNDLIRRGFEIEVETRSISNDQFYEVCKLFSDLGFDSHYHHFLDPISLPKNNDVNPRFILSILEGLVLTFKTQLQVQSDIKDFEAEAYTFMNYLHNVTLQIYPEEVFAVTRAGFFAVFADVDFYKASISQKLGSSQPLNSQRISYNICGLQSVLTEKDILSANLEITTKWVQDLTEVGPNYHRLLIRMMDFILQQRKPIMSRQYAFELDSKNTIKFMRLMVKHILTYFPGTTNIGDVLGKKAYNMTEKERRWLTKIGVFLKNTRQFQPFSASYFEQYVIKEIIRDNLTIDLVKSILVGKKLELDAPLARFYIVMQQDAGTLNNINRMFSHLSLKITRNNRKNDIILPAKIFPNIYSENSAKLPFNLPGKWVNKHEPRITSDGINVHFYDQPHLHRVIMKPTIFQKTNISINFNLCHAVILDTLFNKKLSWSLDEMISALSVRNQAMFSHYLSSLVKHGLLIRKEDGIFALNLGFKPNSKLLVNNIFTIP